MIPKSRQILIQLPTEPLSSWTNSRQRAFGAGALCQQESPNLSVKLQQARDLGDLSGVMAGLMEALFRASGEWRLVR
jgi:hypothetical protein